MSLTPFAILRLTPKNNCGECGHPTCLAFAAAVATTGFPADKCPYIDPTSLPQTRSAQTPAGTTEERDLALIQHLKDKVNDLDFAAIHENLGADWQASNPNAISFHYLGYQVQLGKDSVLLDGHEPSDHRDQILLYNYVHSCGGKPPTENWVGMESLPNSISKIKTLAVYCEERLAQLFSDRNPTLILGTMETMDGRLADEATAAISMIIPVLPRVPLYVLFWEAEPEDGFAAKVKVLFDRHVLDFLDLESLVFTAERLAERFAELLTNTQGASGH